MKSLLVSTLIFCPLLIFAQDNYVFPEFVPGEIYYKATAIAASVNYNLFLSDMLALNGEKKTRLADVDKIEYVNAGNRKFIPLNDNTFGEILIDGGLVLAVKYSGNVVRTGESVKAVSKTSLNKLLDSGKPVPDGVTITVDSSYYFIKQKDERKMFYLPGANVTKATHSGIIKLFVKHKAEISSFIENDKTDFASFESLKRLVEFCEKYTD
jgi:hypothetical protein